MTILRVRLSSAAQKDVATAKEWYLEQPAPDLDLRFQQELERALKQIELFPARFQVVHEDIRKANLYKFPYSVFYRLRGDNVYVVAVLHHARHPGTWMRRG